MRFSGIFFLLFVVVEVWSIVAMGHQIGGWACFGLLVAGFFIGSRLIRYHSLQSLSQSMAQSMAQSAEATAGVDSPLVSLMGSLLITVAGILFIVPGFVSDAIALVLLVPFIRRMIARYMVSHALFKAFGASGFQTGFGGFGGFQTHQQSGFSAGNVYEHEGSSVVKDVPKPAELIESQPEEQQPSPKK